MVTRTVFSRLVSLLLALSILSDRELPVIRAQGDTAPPVLLIQLAGPLSPEQRALAAALAGELRSALDEYGLSASLRWQITESVTPLQDAAAPPLLVQVTSCGRRDCALTFRFGVSTPAVLALLSPALEQRIADTLPITLDHPEAPYDQDAPRAFFAALTSALFGYATANCAAVLPLFETIQPRLTSRMAFYQALCLRAERRYDGALDILAGAQRGALPAGAAGNGGLFQHLWDAYLAECEAQNFAFDRALEWDDYNILNMRAQHDPADPLADQLLAELYLLRGQHRLYLYEWDSVLDDYNAALALAHVPPRTYYDRGLLYYTQNMRQLAYDDLTRFLELETDSESLLVPLARQYVAELEGLLATPPLE